MLFGRPYKHGFNGIPGVIMDTEDEYDIINSIL